MKFSALLSALALGTLAVAQEAATVEDVASPVPADVPEKATEEDLLSKVSDLLYDNGVFNLEAIDARLQVRESSHVMPCYIC